MSDPKTAPVSHKPNSKSKLTGALALGLTIAIGLIFLHFDRESLLTNVIHSWGSLGVILAIAMMVGVCMTPIPSEGLLFIFLKIFGPVLGGLYAWSGAVLASVVVFILARSFVAPILRVSVTESQLKKLNHWISKRGALGLLLVRLLPVPAFIQSYVVGAMPEVSFWNYFWTGAVSIVPYYLGVCLLYVGALSKTTVWIASGIFIVLVLWFIGFLLNRQK